MIPRAKIVFTILATLCCTTMLAIPAKRGQWKTITLSDGRQVRVELRGDERAHWWEDSLHQRYILRGVRNEEGGVKIGSPKDLAESGELSRFIERKDIVFDKETLSIKVKRL
jgi:hypothetical protein